MRPHTIVSSGRVQLTCDFCGCEFTRYLSSFKRNNAEHVFCKPSHRWMFQNAIPLETKFWSRVQRHNHDECWIWGGTIGQHGYGILSISGRPLRVSRLSWEINVGPIPEGLCVLHKCDNPACVNPSHLFVGTLKDNTQDMLRKGRAKYTVPFRGSAHRDAKLNEEQVAEIRRLYSTGSISQDKLGRQFGVCQKTIHRIIYRTRWKHVP